MTASMPHPHSPQSVSVATASLRLTSCHLFQVEKCLLQVLCLSDPRKASELVSFSASSCRSASSSCESERKNRADRACARDGTSHPAPVSSPLYFSGCYLHLVAACAVLLCPSLMCGDVG